MLENDTQSTSAQSARVHDCASTCTRLLETNLYMEYEDDNSAEDFKTWLQKYSDDHQLMTYKMVVRAGQHLALYEAGKRAQDAQAIRHARQHPRQRGRGTWPTASRAYEGCHN